MKVLAVCLGNICRSPVAHGILEYLVKKNGLDWSIDSAGTSDYHLGEAPCTGSIKASANRGIDISHYRARQLQQRDFDDFDLILAMDSSNYTEMKRMAQSEEQKNKIKLVLNFSYPGENRSVPDSYFTGNYKEVVDLLYDASKKIIEQVSKISQ